MGIIGTKPNQVPTNGDLGDLAYKDEKNLNPNVLTKILNDNYNKGEKLNADLLDYRHVGVDPEDIPINAYLGELAFMDKESVVIKPQASVSPQNIGEMVFQLTNDTTLVIKVKGSDGVIRTATLTLA